MLIKSKKLPAALVGFGLLSLLGVWLSLWYTTHAAPVNSMARMHQVSAFMTREEVIKTVGYPPGDYRRHSAYPVYLEGGPGSYRWLFDDGYLIVEFDGLKAGYLILSEPNLTRDNTSICAKLRNYLPF
jgi:hypothetical protein